MIKYNSPTHHFQTSDNPAGSSIDTERHATVEAEQMRLQQFIWVGGWPKQCKWCKHQIQTAATLKDKITVTRPWNKESGLWAAQIMSTKRRLKKKEKKQQWQKMMAKRLVIGGTHTMGKIYCQFIATRLAISIFIAMSRDPGNIYCNASRLGQ